MIVREYGRIHVYTIFTIGPGQLVLNNTIVIEMKNKKVSYLTTLDRLIRTIIAWLVVFSNLRNTTARLAPIICSLTNWPAAEGKEIFATDAFAVSLQFYEIYTRIGWRSVVHRGHLIIYFETAIFEYAVCEKNSTFK